MGCDAGVHPSPCPHQEDEGMRRHVATIAALTVMAAGCGPHHKHRYHGPAVLGTPLEIVADPTTTTAPPPSTTISTVERTSTTIRASRGSPRVRQTPTTISQAPVVSASPAGATAEASWYGPGFYGHGTACGQTMTEGLSGVAHRTLPCGTMVTFTYAGRSVTVPVVDRGPYVRGRMWDLTYATCRAIAHCFTGPIGWAVA